MLCRVNVLKKIEKGQRKFPYHRPASVTSSYDFIKARLHHGCFLKYVSTFFGTAISQNSERLYLRNPYLFGKPNNYCCGRAVQGQIPKCIPRNIETLSQKTGNIS